MVLMGDSSTFFSRAPLILFLPAGSCGPPPVLPTSLSATRAPWAAVVGLWPLTGYQREAAEAGMEDARGRSEVAGDAETYIRVGRWSPAALSEG